VFETEMSYRYATTMTPGTCSNQQEALGERTFLWPLTKRRGGTFRAVIPEPMLSRSGPIPMGRGWQFEPKWDGFRAIVSTVDGFRVRSRRGWNMTEKLPELRHLPAGLVLDGELVAWKKGVPHFPLLTRRILNGDQSVAVTFMAFDLLADDGKSLLDTPLAARRALLESLDLNCSYWMTPDTFADGPELFQAICVHGLEGIVAKRTTSPYRPGYRGWVKVKNPAYWRRDQELESLRRSLERRVAA
jgi:ATP-dependent DNA ligase